MKRRILPVLIGVVMWAMAYTFVNVVQAEECDNPGALTDTAKISECISKYNGIADAISKANSNNQQELNSLNAQVSKLKGQIGSLGTQLDQLGKDIFDREVKVGVKEALLSAKVRQDYMRRREQPILLLLFSSESASKFFSDLAYREKLARGDKQVIDSVTGEIVDLRAQTEAVKKQKESLDGLRARVDKQADFLEAEVAKANSYVADLGSKISALNTRQSQLLAEKTGTYATSVGDVPLADDPAARPDYNPGFSPAFAMFSFGAPHFKGMSQYGAFGRAKSGQNYETILKAYYGNVRIVDVNTSLTIKTSAGAMSFEDRYVRGIAEMPSSWGGEGGMEALKAQAIAARSYALAYTGWRMNSQNAGGTICVTESCQVWKASKADSGGAWAEAVNATKGKIVVSNTSNEIVNTWYSSTSGGHQDSYSSLGHSTPGFWDTTSDWTRWADGAWEKTGGSPWFYKGWYKSRSGKTCGRNHPWLNQAEFSDMVNAAIVVSAGGDVTGIYPEDVRSCWGGDDNPWSKDRMGQEADKHGGRVTSVSSVRVEHGNNGVTSRVIMSTSRGEVSISGSDFKKAFNLRAPGALALKSGLFNIEKK